MCPSSYPASRVNKDSEGQETGVAGSLNLQQNATLSTQPISSFDWSPDKEGLAVCTSFDQQLRVVIVTKLKTIWWRTTSTASLLGTFFWVCVVFFGGFLRERASSCWFVRSVEKGTWREEFSWCNSRHVWSDGMREREREKRERKRGERERGERERECECVCESGCMCMQLILCSGLASYFHKHGTHMYVYTLV